MPQRTVIAASLVCGIGVGMFARKPAKWTHVAMRCFSVVTSKRTLDVVCADTATYVAWTTVLQHLLSQAHVTATASTGTAHVANNMSTCEDGYATGEMDTLTRMGSFLTFEGSE